MAEQQCKCGCCAPTSSDAETRADLEREKREAQRRVEELERRIEKLEGTPA